MLTVPHSGRPGIVLGDVLPLAAAVPRDVHEAVVAARPDQTLLQRRLGDHEDRAVGLDAGVVAGDRTAGPLLLGLVVAGQVRADRRPGLAAVARCGRARWRRGRRSSGRAARRAIGRGPLEAVAHVLAGPAGGVVRPGADVARLPRAVVVARHDAQVLAGVDDVRVGGVGDHPAGLAAAHAVPVGVGDPAAAQRVARPLRRADVLQGAGDLERHAVVHGHVVELADRQRRRDPGLAAVVRDVDAAVVGADHPLGVRGIDPQVVVVAVAEEHLLERLAAVDALEHAARWGPRPRRGWPG